MKVKTDIDIDLADRDSILQHIKHIPASMIQKGEWKKHNSGVYLSEIPTNPLTGLSTIEYKEAEDRGYFKIDFLNNHIYDDVKSEEHLDKLADTEPNWDLFLITEITEELAHLKGHSDVLQTMKPRSVEQLAAVIAMIRPAKRHLVGKSWDEVFESVWIKPEEDVYYFKHAHSIAYAVSIIVQLNLICEQVE